MAWSRARAALTWLLPAFICATAVNGCGEDDEKGGATGGQAGKDSGTDSSSGGTAGVSGSGGSVAGAAGTDAAAGSGGSAGDPGDAASAASCQNCHVAISDRMSKGKHSTLTEGCISCHANGLVHQASPSITKASVEFTLDVCAKCHGDYKDSYLKDDGLKAGSYGGSAKTSKYVDFPKYQHLMGGHGFTVEYNEERAHTFLLKDHREIKRKQNMVCLQCKSTPVTYYFNEQRRGAYLYSMETTWADAIASIQQNWPTTMDHGASCTQCHDPHGTSFRVIRKAMIKSILERGTDPYDPVKNVVPKTEAALNALLNEKGTDGKLTGNAKRLAGTLTCAQCHVEYTCGPGIDKTVLRDDFPWRKLKDIEDYYKVKYALQQDWKHTGTDLPGIKAQHPETEFFWGSKHDLQGVACADCHMGKSPSASTTSHWFTSPYKQPAETCGKCHKTDVNPWIKQMKDAQDATWNQAKQVETTLDQVLTKIEAEKVTPTVSAQNLAEAKNLFMRALLWWEWTIVSENSTGAHNPAEAKTNLDLAALEAGKAKTLLGL